MLSVKRSGSTFLVIERTSGKERVIRRCDSWTEAAACAKRPEDVQRPRVGRDFTDRGWDNQFAHESLQRRELTEVDHRDVYSSRHA